MFNRRHRFHGYGSLKAVYQRGRTTRGQLINLKLINRGPDKAYRVAVVVSRKVSKSAVTRNRIRRRVYETVRSNQADLQPGSDMVFTVFSDQLANIEPTKLNEIITKLLRDSNTAG